MIIRSGIIVILVFGRVSFAQNRIFLDNVHESPDYYYDDDASITESRIDLLNFNADRVATLAVKAIQNERMRRFRPELVQDSLLNRIARSGIETFNKRRFVHSNTWKKERRNIKYALQRERSDYKLYAAHAFVFDMLDLKFAETFYPNKEIGTSETNLYVGKIPETFDPESEDYAEPVPVEALTEELFCKKLVKLLSKGMYRRDFLSKKFTRVGVALKIDKSSLNRRVRPQLFVIVIFGGKQLQTLDVPEGMKSDSYSKFEE